MGFIHFQQGVYPCYRENHRVSSKLPLIVTGLNGTVSIYPSWGSDQWSQLALISRCVIRLHGDALGWVTTEVLSRRGWWSRASLAADGAVPGAGRWKVQVTPAGDTGGGFCHQSPRRRSTGRLIVFKHKQHKAPGRGKGEEGRGEGCSGTELTYSWSMGTYPRVCMRHCAASVKWKPLANVLGLWLSGCAIWTDTVMPVARVWQKGGGSSLKREHPKKQ